MTDSAVEVESAPLNNDCFGIGFRDREPYSKEIMSLVPKKNDDFVGFGVYDDVMTAISSEVFYPIYIVGPSGTGKSSMVEHICHVLKKPLIRINLNMMVDEDQLIGTRTLVDGNIEVIKGPVIRAMENGIPILLDEIDAAHSNTILCIQSILEGKPYYFKLLNEVIFPRNGFTIIVTANTKGRGSDDGKYVGTNIQHEGFLERFAVTFEQKYPPVELERDILYRFMKSLDCFNKQFAENLLRWVEMVRRTFDDNGIDETITTRRLIHIVKNFKIYNDEFKAIEFATNRYDEHIKASFLKTYKTTCRPLYGSDGNETDVSPEQMYQDLDSLEVDVEIK